ncbi:hypothetical protein ACQ4PT_053378 [Festuca glaucescens]
MAMWLLLPRLCLVLSSLTGAACSASPVVLQWLNASAAENPQIPPGVGRALSAPIIGHGGRLVACSGKNLLAFHRNGSLAWIVPLGYNCRQDISLVTERDKIYLVTEDNKVIKISPQSLQTSAPSSEVFFSHNPAPGRSEEIIGLSTSSSYSSLFITIANRGLFSFSLRGGQLQWSAGPVIDRFGYRLGCKRNISGCYFSSAPVVDQCEGTLYISNTEGQLYSMFIHSRQYRWIQDLSSIDKVITIAPGNNGRLYILLPRKSVVLGLDVLSGNISWQQSIGPLSNEKILPAVDSNGQLSNLLSSSDLEYFTLDETILLTALSAARIGSAVQCYTKRQKIAWTCRKAKPKFVHGDPGDHNHVLLLFFFQLFVIVIQAVVVRFCCIFWRKKKLQKNNGLQKFLEKRRSLHSKRRVLGNIISELEQKAAQDASSNETLEHLGEMVKAKECVERKLYTSYSLGRDVLGLRRGSSSILPLYNGKHKSHSFHGAQRESITIFNMLSDSSSLEEDRTSSSYSSSSGSYSGSSSGDMEFDTGSRSAGEAGAGPSNTADVTEGDQDKLPADVESSYQVFMNPLYAQGESSSRSLSEREEFLMPQGSAPTKRMWLKRRRTLSSTN